MRQLLFGLLAAALVFLVYSRLSGGAGGGRPDPVIEAANLDQILERTTPAATEPRPVVEEAARLQPLDSGRSTDPGPEQALAGQVQAALASVDAAETAKVWAVLATPTIAAAQREQVVRAIAAVVPQDAERAVAMLGDHNRFLHSPEGRAAAGRALELCAGLSDERAVLLTTRLLESCMRGPIEKGQKEARAFVDQTYAEHRKRVDRWLCDPANLTRARSYQVQRGDSLQKIATSFRKQGILVEEGTLAVLNRLHNPNVLRPEQQIKVPIDPVRTVVEKRSFLMAVYVGELIMRLYWVGHGTNDKTPVTEFSVLEKTRDPDWYSPEGVIPFGHPKNILGKYFVKFGHASYQGFGAHGTAEPETIGTMASDGCIRMFDKDIADFFTVVPRGTVVAIRAS